MSNIFCTPIWYTYACQSWGQSFNTLNKMQALQVTAAWIIVFRTNNDNVGELLRVCWRELFICKRCTNKFVNPPFQNYFIKS